MNLCSRSHLIPVEVNLRTDLLHYIVLIQSPMKVSIFGTRYSNNHSTNILPAKLQQILVIVGKHYDLTKSSFTDHSNGNPPTQEQNIERSVFSIIRERERESELNVISLISDPSEIEIMDFPLTTYTFSVSHSFYFTITIKTLAPSIP